MLSSLEASLDDRVVDNAAWSGDLGADADAGGWKRPLRAFLLSIGRNPSLKLFGVELTALRVKVLGDDNCSEDLGGGGRNWKGRILALGGGTGSGPGYTGFLRILSILSQFLVLRPNLRIKKSFNFSRVRRQETKKNKAKY